MAADAVSAALLYRLSKSYASSKSRAVADGSCWGAALLFLWNPCAIATCVGCVMYSRLTLQLDRSKSRVWFLAGEAGVRLTQFLC